MTTPERASGALRARSLEKSGLWRTWGLASGTSGHRYDRRAA
jgi:hypothetical protein